MLMQLQSQVALLLVLVQLQLHLGAQELVPRHRLVWMHVEYDFDHEDETASESAEDEVKKNQVVDHNSPDKQPTAAIN